MIKKIKAFDRDGESGFTLIEMLIVIAVIAILAGVVLTGVSGFQASARDTRRIGDLRNVQNHLELFFNRCGYYPGTISGGQCAITNPTSWDDLKSTMETEGFTSNFPEELVGTRPDYEYAPSADNLGYVLKANLERENSALNDDVDGTVNGISCDDGTSAPFAYCIQS